MTEGSFKALVSATVAVVWAYFGHILIPVAVLVFVMLCDYVTGVAAAWVRSELSSRTGLIGIIKKIGYLFLVAVGCVIDYLVSVAGDSLGLLDGAVKFAALLVVFWLIINELISILENVRRLGVPVPPWLGGILNRLKQTTDAAAPASAEEPAGKHERR